MTSNVLTEFKLSPAKVRKDIAVGLVKKSNTGSDWTFFGGDFIRLVAKTKPIGTIEKKNANAIEFASF